jgi:hypothetical protein
MGPPVVPGASDADRGPRPYRKPAPSARRAPTPQKPRWDWAGAAAAAGSRRPCEASHVDECGGARLRAYAPAGRRVGREKGPLSPAFNFPFKASSEDRSEARRCARNCARERAGNGANGAAWCRGEMKNALASPALTSASSAVGGLRRPLLYPTELQARPWNSHNLRSYRQETVAVTVGDLAPRPHRTPPQVGPGPSASVTEAVRRRAELLPRRY